MSNSELVLSICPSRSTFHLSLPRSLPGEADWYGSCSFGLQMVWPVGRPGRRSEGRRRVLAEYLFPWIPSCEAESMPLNRSLWSSQGILLYLTLSLQLQEPLNPSFILAQGWSQSGYYQPWVSLLYMYCGSQIALPL